MLRSVPLLPVESNCPTLSTLPAHIRHSGEHILSLAFFATLSMAPLCVSGQTDQPSGSGQQANPQEQICDGLKQSDSHALSLGIAKPQSLDNGTSAAEQQSASPGSSEWRSKDVGLPEVQRTSSLKQEQPPICKKMNNTGETGRSADTLPRTNQAPEPGAVTDGATISYDDGKLTIDARNVSLGEVIKAIRARFGIAVEYPSEMMNDRVFEHVGPAPFRDALSQLLYGSRFNYIIQTSSQDPELVTKLILSAQSRVASAERPQANQPAVDQADNQASSGEASLSDETPVQPVQVIQSGVAPSAVPGIPAGFNVQQAATAAGKTPGQILDELQKHQLQVLDDQSPPPQ